MTLRTTKQRDGIVFLIDGTTATRIAEGAGYGITLLDDKLYTTIDQQTCVTEPA